MSESLAPATDPTAAPASTEPKPRVPGPRPYFDHPRVEYAWRNGFPAPARHMMGLFILVGIAALVASAILASILGARTGPAFEPHPLAPLHTPVVTALLLLAGLAVYGFVLVVKRRNGARALAFLLALIPCCLFMTALATGRIGIDEEEVFESLVAIAFGLVMLPLGVVQPFRAEARDWFAPPIGYYEYEGERLRPQIPFPLALALTGLWTCIVLVALGVPTIYAAPELLLAAGANKTDLDQMRWLAWGLANWAVVQTVLCMVLLCRKNTARILTAAAALLAVPAGAGIGWLAWNWSGSVTAGAATAALLTAGALTCWVLTTHPVTTTWCTEHPHRRPVPSQQHAEQ